jgi:hypothetical protein
MSANWIETNDEADEFLARHDRVRLNLRKVRGGWVAEIDGTRERPLPHGPMPIAALRMTLAIRYLAECYDKTAHVNLVWARRMPNWAGDLGALPEIAAAILRAESTMATA